MVTFAPVTNSTGGDTKVAPGKYRAKLVAAEDSTSTQYGSEQILWKFQLIRCLEAEPDEEQEDSIGEEVWHWTRPWLGYNKDGAKSKGLIVVDALCATSTPRPADGEELAPPVASTDDLVGMNCDITVDVVANKVGNFRAKIVMFQPIKPRKTADAAKQRPRGPRPPVADDEDFDDIEP